MKLTEVKYDSAHKKKVFIIFNGEGDLGMNIVGPFVSENEANQYINLFTEDELGWYISDVKSNISPREWMDHIKEEDRWPT